MPVLQPAHVFTLSHVVIFTQGRRLLLLSDAETGRGETESRALKVERGGDGWSEGAETRRSREQMDKRGRGRRRRSAKRLDFMVKTLAAGRPESSSKPKLVKFCRPTSAISSPGAELRLGWAAAPPPGARRHLFSCWTASWPAGPWTPAC